MSAHFRKTLAAAKRGDFASVQDLCRFSYRYPDLFKRTASYMRTYLHAVPSPLPLETDQLPTDKDVLAAITLRCIDDNRKIWVKDEEICLLMDRIFQEEMTNILRWMSRLFTVLVFDCRDYHDDVLRPSPSAGGSSADDELTPSDVKEFRSVVKGWVVKAVPSLLYLMQERSPDDMYHRMKDNAHIGSLLVQMFVMADSENDSRMIISGHLLRTKLPSGGPSRPRERWEVDFFQYAKQHSAPLVKSIICSLSTYIVDPSKNAYALLALVTVLYDCNHHRDDEILLDAFLSYEGSIRVLTLALHTWIGHIQHLQPTRTPFESETIFKIAFTLNILGSSFSHGGPAVTSISLDHGLLEAFSALRALTNGETLPMGAREGLEYLDEMSRKVVIGVLLFTTYPFIFRTVLDFFAQGDGEDAEYWKVKKGPRSVLTELDRAWGGLFYKVDDDAKLLHRFGVQDAPPNHLTRFCDNVDCPHPGRVVKLGQCTSCLSGYYCSRHCQKSVWKKGHRLECKDITRSRKAMTGFPMVLAIHDREYFRRTLVSRFRQWKSTERKADEELQLVTRNSIVVLNVDIYPLQVEIRDYSVEADADLRAPSIKAKMSTCRGFTKVNPVQWVSVDLPLDLLDDDGGTATTNLT